MVLLYVHFTNFLLFSSTLPVLTSLSLTAVCIALACLWGFYAHKLPRRTRHAAICVLILLFPFVHFFLIARYAINIPSWDDFDAILLYMNRPLQERFTLTSLFHLHNEHRILLTRLTAELCSSLSGSVQLKWITISGTGYLAALYAALLMHLRKSVSPVQLPLMGAMLFAPFAWINMMWSTTAVQFNAALFFSFTACILFFSSRASYVRILFCISAFLASFSTGSGIFTVPAILGTFMLLWGDAVWLRNGVDGRHRVMDLILLVLLGLFLATAYFYNYAHPEHHPDVQESLFQPVRIIHYILLFLGSIFLNGQAALALGALLLFLFGFITIQHGYRKVPGLYAFLIYLLLTAAATAVGRSGFGVAQALEVRYRINSVLFLTVTLAVLLRLYPAFFSRKSILSAVFSVLLIVFTLATWSASGAMQQWRKKLISVTAKYMAFGHGLHYPQESSAYAADIFDSCVENGVYCPPSILHQYAAKFKAGETPEQ